MKHRSFNQGSRKSSKKSSKSKKNRLIVLGVVLFYVVFKFFDYTFFPANPGSEETTTFLVKQGESVKEIGERLEDKGIILSNWAFYLYVRTHGIAPRIQAGRFTIGPHMSAKQIAEKLTNTETSEGVVTIPEGFTVKQIDARLASKGLIQAGELMDCLQFTCMNPEDIPNYMNGPGTSLEGFLYPETYFIDSTHFSLPDFINRLINTFEDRVVTPENLKAVGDRTLYEIIIMASMIEKEVRTEADRAQVADILWRRLDAGWMLGIDATLLYQREQNESKTLTNKDIAEDSPYNTRKRAGLPPTAISNPGLPSIQAALYPKPNRFWFYLTKPETGEVVYAFSNEEHNENRAQYLR